MDITSMSLDSPDEPDVSGICNDVKHLSTGTKREYLSNRRSSGVRNFSHIDHRQSVSSFPVKQQPQTSLMSISLPSVEKDDNDAGFKFSRPTSHEEEVNKFKTPEDRNIWNILEETDISEPSSMSFHNRTRCNKSDVSEVLASEDTEPLNLSEEINLSQGHILPNFSTRPHDRGKRKHKQTHRKPLHSGLSHGINTQISGETSQLESETLSPEQDRNYQRLPVLRSLKMAIELDQYMHRLNSRNGRSEAISKTMLPLIKSRSYAREGGPIARPHSPRKTLMERQKTRYGGSALRRGYKDSQVPTVDRLQNQQIRLYAAHSDLKTVLQQRR